MCVLHARIGVNVTEMFRRLTVQFRDQGLMCLLGINGSKKNRHGWKIGNTIIILRPGPQAKTFAQVETLLKRRDELKFENYREHWTNL